jgi:hypothetical protein
MKGIELPVNALIIIVIAVLVLLGIVALWMSGWGSGSMGVTLEAAKEGACGTLMRYYGGCAAVVPYTIRIGNFDADRDGTNDGSNAPGSWCWNAGDPPIPACTAKSVCANPLLLPEKDNLASLCACYYNAWSDSACRKICGCGS